MVERLAARRLDAIVAATPAIADRFRRYGARVVLVRNSVKLDEFAGAAMERETKRQAVDVGRVSFDRGLIEMVEACQAVGLPLAVAGTIAAREQAWLERHGAAVEWLGKLDRAGIAALLSESSVGLSLLHPEPNYLHALPTKLFEYMAAGLPVVTSDLPASKAIVEQAGCGIAVGHGDARALRAALAMLSADARAARAMGLRGRAAVARQYNWARDSAALIALYDDFSSRPA